MVQMIAQECAALTMVRLAVLDCSAGSSAALVHPLAWEGLAEEKRHQGEVVPEEIHGLEETTLMVEVHMACYSQVQHQEHRESHEGLLVVQNGNSAGEGSQTDQEDREMVVAGFRATVGPVVPVAVVEGVAGVERPERL